MEYGSLIKKIPKWIKTQLEEAGLEGLVIGASGGIDSSVTIKLANKIFTKNILCLIMPCGNSSEEENKARYLLENNNIPYKYINFENIFHEFLKSTKNKEINPNLANVDNKKNKLALANTKARVRMMLLYYYAQINNYMVVGTGNRTELEIGYFTKYGDGGADILPLAGLFKREVINIGKKLKVPERILTQTPSGGLWKSQTDEKEIGLTYDELEFGIRKYYNMKTKGFNLCINMDKKVVIEKTKRMIENNKHKTQMPPRCKIERKE